MNPANPVVLPLGKEFKSLMVPKEVLPMLPSPLVTFVGIPAWRHWLAGSQSIVVIVTTTPPPEQFPTDNWPMVAAEADGGNVANANTAKPKITDLSTFRCFTVFLRSLHWDAI
jgi:hypothetical protein